MCSARIDAVMREEALPGDTELDAARIEILGRAKGEPMVFVRPPKHVEESELTTAQLDAKRAFDKGTPGHRVHVLKGRLKLDPEGLRKILLAEGYAYSTNPQDALAVSSAITLPDIFRDPTIYLMRGSTVYELERQTSKRNETSYRFKDGRFVGRSADLLFGDRVALTREALANPIHRDLKALADQEGFDRATLERRTKSALLATLKYGDVTARALLESDGAALHMGCVEGPRSAREKLEEQRKLDGPRRRAMNAIHEIITQEVQEAARFDRPEGVKGPDQDGELRPVWASAYFGGRQSFDYQGTTYAVFDQNGAAWPPMVCVDFVLDTFERASGTWYAPRGEALRRIRGRLDFNDEKIENRRGVMGFGKFAETRPDLFSWMRVPETERIKFEKRAEYFKWFSKHEGQVRAGDILAIHGMKADKRIHQHAIFVEWTDPLTGFPYGLADQMKHPRRRTWEGIMAEAPLRSLYYRVRPTDAVLAKVDPG